MKKIKLNLSLKRENIASVHNIKREKRKKDRQYYYINLGNGYDELFPTKKWWQIWK